MPFGITGAPSKFRNMMAIKTHDLTMDRTFKLFINDGGSALDTFKEGVMKLHTILKWV